MTIIASLVKHKYAVGQVLVDFVHYVENQFKFKVLCIHSDNALEFTSKELQQFYHNRGIIHQTNYSYAPQQNGVMERKHGHLLETTRALFYQSKLPERFRGECV